MTARKCPFCGTVLGQVPNTLMFCCRNKGCGFSRECMELHVWQALADGKKAQDALKEATKCISWTIDTIYRRLDREADIVGCCELSLERINEITKQEA